MLTIKVHLLKCYLIVNQEKSVNPCQRARPTLDFKTLTIKRIRRDSFQADATIENWRHKKGATTVIYNIEFPLKTKICFEPPIKRREISPMLTLSEIRTH